MINCVHGCLMLHSASSHCVQCLPRSDSSLMAVGKDSFSPHLFYSLCVSSLFLLSFPLCVGADCLALYRNLCWVYGRQRQQARSLSADTCRAMPCHDSFEIMALHRNSWECTKPSATSWLMMNCSLGNRILLELTSGRYAFQSQGYKKPHSRIV